MLELLELVVPGLQHIRHHWEPAHLGIRGITGDREDKILLRVNGRVLNERTKRGAITERDFPFMGDIRRIDIIRGPGTATYGLGAVSMVIDITTYDAETNTANGASFRVGNGMNYLALETKFSKVFANGLGMYFYSELADVEGADADSAPLVYGADATSVATGRFIPKGSSFPTRTKDQAAFEDRVFAKGHLNGACQ